MRNRSLIGTLVALLLMSGAAAASAQEVTQAEKDRALQYLESTKKNVLEATKGLSEEKWHKTVAIDGRGRCCTCKLHKGGVQIDILRDLFSVARFPERTGNGRAGSVDDWVDAFKRKRDEIVHQTCPS